jgi:dienelactone hydrolase
MLLRPAGTRRYPLALISHGTPRDAAERAGMSPYVSFRQALEFARRGFAALVVMRRGYGDSGGDDAEDGGPCGQRDYSLAAKASASDLRAAIEAIKGRTDISTSGMIALGVWSGGFATVALTADPPAGLAAAISFAGGRGSRADNDVCDEEALVREFGILGRTSRIPMLWISARNDRFFWPDLAHRMHAAFTGAGGRAQFVDAPSTSDNGDFLFSTAIPLWTPMVDDFLRDQNLGTRDFAAVPAPTALAQPPQLGEKGRAGFSDDLSANPHNAFFRCRQEAPSLTAADAARRAKRPTLRWPHVRILRRIARSMRSTANSPTRPAPHHAEEEPIRRLSLPFRRRHHEAVELVADLDLARQPRIRPHVEAEIQHVFFHRRRGADLFAPRFVDINMAGRARTGAAAFGFDAGDGVADRSFHHGCAVFDFDGSCFAGMVDKVNFGHDRSCCRNAKKRFPAVL